MYTRKPKLTNFIIQHLLFSIPQRFHNFEDGLKEAQVTQATCLIIKLLPLCILSDGHKDVGFWVAEFPVKRVLLGLSPQVCLDGFQGGITIA